MGFRLSASEAAIIYDLLYFSLVKNCGSVAETQSINLSMKI